MAQAKKTVKKTKPAAKKTVAAAAPKAPKAPVMAAECPCCTGHHNRGCLKKLVVFLLGVIVGGAVCCSICDEGKYGRKMWGKKFGMHKEMFVNGCLDTAKIDCPEKLEKIQLKDADKNGCITKEEFFGDKKPCEGQGCGCPDCAKKQSMEKQGDDQPRPMKKFRKNRM